MRSLWEDGERRKDPVPVFGSGSRRSEQRWSGLIKLTQDDQDEEGSNAKEADAHSRSTG